MNIAGMADDVTGKKGHGPVKVDATVDDVEAQLVPGSRHTGRLTPDKLRRSKRLLSLVEPFSAAGKPIAFICHAGWVPVSANIITGRRATSVDAVRDDMVNAGADWVDEPCVVDAT